MGRHLLNGLAMLSLAAVMVFSMPAGEQTNAPANASVKGSAATNAVDVWKLMEDYFAAVAKNQLPKAAGLGQQVMVGGTNDWNALRFFSWRIFADRGIKH